MPAGYPCSCRLGRSAWDESRYCSSCLRPRPRTGADRRPACFPVCQVGWSLTLLTPGRLAGQGSAAITCGCKGRLKMLQLAARIAGVNPSPKLCCAS